MPLKKIVIRNSGCCKEMTTMTMFWGVSGSEVCEWDTKRSATDPWGQGAFMAGAWARISIAALRPLMAITLPPG